MKDSGFTKSERHLKALLKIWAILFIAAAVLLAAIPDIALNYISQIGWTFLNFPMPSTHADSFYLILAVGYLVTLAYLCFMAQRDIILYLNLVPPVILAKFVTSVGYAVLAIKDFQFLYIAGALVDGMICLVTLYYYRRSKLSRTR